MTKSEFREVAKTYAMCTDKDEALRWVNAFYCTIISEMRRGGEIRLPGLGTFKCVVVPERERVNPHTLAKIIVPEHCTVKFKPSKKMLEELN